jgi:hypothetical protein
MNAVANYPPFSESSVWPNVIDWVCQFYGHTASFSPAIFLPSGPATG